MCTQESNERLDYAAHHLTTHTYTLDTENDTRRCHWLHHDDEFGFRLMQNQEDLFSFALHMKAYCLRVPNANVQWKAQRFRKMPLYSFYRVHLTPSGNFGGEY